MRRNYNELKITIWPKKGLEALIHELKKFHTFDKKYS